MDVWLYTNVRVNTLYLDVLANSWDLTESVVANSNSFVFSPVNNEDITCAMRVSVSRYS